jgi:hypothetical protein
MDEEGGGAGVVVGSDASPSVVHVLQHMQPWEGRRVNTQAAQRCTALPEQSNSAIRHVIHPHTITTPLALLLAKSFQQGHG